MITSSATKNQRNASIGGVGFVCKNKYLNSITKTEKISSRILRIDLKGNPATTILSCYAPTNMANDIVAAEFFDKLSDAIEDIPLHNILLVCGDFNAKIGPESTLFTYNKRTNRNGTLLLDLMDSHQLYAANLTFQKPQCRLWTFRYPNGNKGQMDYIIARRKWSKSISNVNAFTNIFSSLHSDHRPLIAEVQLKLRKSVSTIPKNSNPNFKLLHGNHDLQHQYTLTVQNRFAALSNTNSVTPENYHLLEVACTEVGNKLLPPSKPEKWSNIASKPSVMAARNEMHQAISTGNRSAIKQKKTNLQNAYKLEETKLIENKTKQLEQKYFHNQHSEAWKIVKELSGSSSKTPKSSTIGSPAQDKSNWLKHFSKLLSSTTSNPSPEPPDPIENIVHHTLPIDTSPFHEDELHKAMKKTKRKTQVGPDNVPLEVWESPLFFQQLLNLCNLTFINKVKPSNWSKSHIIPIHKKGDKGLPSNYRGISLNTIASKLYNRMILFRIQPHIDKILSWTQAGFRKSRSTLSNILALRRIIEGMRQKNLTLAMVFVDFSKAFDSINREEMFKILEAYGIPKEIVQGIKIIYENNTAAVITPIGLTEYFKITAGIFQGDTLAPLLFIIVIDYILRKTFKTTTDQGIEILPRQGSRQPAENIKDLSYADDVTLLAQSLENAEQLLIKLEKAAAQVGLDINTDKTKVMTVNNTINYQIKTSKDIPIEETTTFKYLGSNIPDSTTDFNKRKSLAWAAMKKLDKIWKSSIHRSLKIRFFLSSVESILLYGSEAWTVPADLKSKIDGCYTKLLRRVLNVKWQEHMTNERLYQNLPKLSKKIQIRRLKFAGHCARATDQPVNRLLFWSPQGGRTNRGRPLKTFKDNLAEDTGLQNQRELLQLMKNKDLWKEFVNNL